MQLVLLLADIYFHANEKQMQLAKNVQPKKCMSFLILVFKLLHMSDMKR